MKAHKLKLTFKVAIVIIIMLSACIGLKPTHRLLDQKDAFIWIGQDNSKNYLLKIDQTDGKWFTGKIIIDAQDTLYLKGFEKGNNHPTTVKEYATDSIHCTELGFIFIWTSDKADSLRIENKHDSIPQLPAQLILFKRQKTSIKLSKREK
jgi:hypothetical protein